MARGKNKSKLIQVKAAPTDTNVVVNLVDLSTEINNDALKPEVMQKLIENITDDIATHGSLATNDERAADYVSAMKQITPRKANDVKRLEDEFIEVQLKIEGEADNVNEILNPELMVVGRKIEGDKSEVVVIKKKKKGGKKKKKRDKKKKDEVNSVPETVEDIVTDQKPVKLPPITRKKGQENDYCLTEVKVPALKPAGCFGFISTWIAKRKEKRRMKKKKAIKARTNAPGESLLEYEHKIAKGGVAFTVEMDSRPIARSVLPPIKQKPGPIRMATEQRLAIADYNRMEQMSKKRENARAHSRLVREVADRRVQNESSFRQATLQKIKDKEHRAERAVSRLEYARNERCLSRCASRVKNRLGVLTSKMESTMASPATDVFSPVPSEEDPFSFWDIECNTHYTAD
ncbi:hypothetical protein ACF0H5_012809 [Mactra antiquata]